MIRTQVQLTEAQVRALRRAAVARGISVAQLIRELVDSGLEGHPPARATRARAVVGAFASGTRSTSRDHDAALNEAFIE